MTELNQERVRRNAFKQRARNVGMDGSAAEYAGSDALPVIKALEVLQTAGPRSFKVAKSRAEKALYDFQTVDFEEALKLKALISTAKPLSEDPQPSRNPRTGLQEFSDPHTQPENFIDPWTLKRIEEEQAQAKIDAPYLERGLDPERVRELQGQHDRMNVMKGVGLTLGGAGAGVQLATDLKLLPRLGTPIGWAGWGLGTATTAIAENQLSDTAEHCAKMGLGPDCRLK